MQIGRKLYYDLVTGNVIVDTGERSGDVIETTTEQDFAAYAMLAGRVPDTIGVMQLEHGQYEQDFADLLLYQVDVSSDPPSLLFCSRS
ncbi:hypothetical protein ACFSR7_14160 [Cohnella sp. GCM10020058]|uniref:hypothetical protein n=1 Tax=Cohnella sp. GCM10020058 TaxID=3317330 RepID=UPI003627D736